MRLHNHGLKMIRKFILRGIIWFSIYVSALSAHSNIELILDGGVDWFSPPKSTHIIVTDIETDSIEQGTSHATGDIGLAVNYRFPLLNNIQTPWFNQFGVGLNLRYSGFSNFIIDGQVYQFEQADLNNYRYRLYFENTRLLAQLTFDVLTYKQASLFILGGLGGGWSKFNYEDKPISSDLEGGVSLNNKHTTKLVTDAGIGLNYHYSAGFSYSLSYLYTNYGHISASSSGQLNGEYVTLASPAYALSSNTLLVGVHYVI